jgi:hypothetical protein
MMWLVLNMEWKCSVNVVAANYGVFYKWSRDESTIDIDVDDI